jgi:glutamyl-tRNA reductase
VSRHYTEGAGWPAGSQEATYCLGLSHQDTQVAVREAVASSATELAQALVEWQELDSLVKEWVVLSTCNRFELYVHMAAEREAAEELLAGWLYRARGIDEETSRPHFYLYQDAAAAAHLLRVAAGLESLVLGEPQILGQVTGALETAQMGGSSGPVLTALFQAAIRAGKRARSETAISRHCSSISSVAISRIESTHGSLKDLSVLVIGVGEMAQLALSALRSRGVGRLAIVNRTCERANALLGDGEGRAFRLDQLREALVSADAVISATGAPHLILSRDTVAAALSERPERRLTLVDIAVPLDIDPEVATLPGARLVNMDALHDGLASARQARESEVPRVETIVEDEMSRWRGKVRELQVLPVIKRLHLEAESIRRRELERTMRHIGEVDSDTMEHIQHLSCALVNQLLHRPTRKLRQEAGHDNSAGYVAVVEELFDLSSDR